MHSIPVIRDVTVNDLSLIAAIHNSYLGKATLDLEKRDREFFESILNDLKERERFLVITYNDEVIGYGRLMYYSYKLGYQTTAETSVFLDPRFTGKGFGDILKRNLIAQAQDLGFHHLIARIMANNDVSINYNMKLGYKLVGIQKEIGEVNGKYVDVAILQMIL